MDVRLETEPALQDSELTSLLPESAVSRRMFVAGATVTTGLALSVRPASATMIKTDMKGLKGGMVNVPVGDTRIPRLHGDAGNRYESSRHPRCSGNFRSS